MKNHHNKNELPQPIIYTPRSELKTPTILIKKMFRDLLLSRELAWRLMIRDISAQYRQSILGIFWAFLTPIATAFIFVILNKQKIINIGETNIPYPAYVMFGTTLWQIFTDSLNAPLKMVTASKPLLAKINFPKEALILSGLGQVLFHLNIKLIILLLILFIFKIHPSFGLLFSLLAIFVLIILGTTIGLLLTPIGILYTDIVHGLTILVAVWFLFTPIVYPPLTNFPFSLITMINPVSPILIGARDLATQGTLNNPLSFFTVTLFTLVFFIIAWILYRITIPVLIERLNA